MIDLILIRGLPGSGKSFLANEFVSFGFQHVEADMWFYRDGQYMFDGQQLPAAHQWCRNRTRNLLTAGKRVVVSNTFSRNWEMQPYLDIATDLGKTYHVIQTEYPGVSAHGVPDGTVAKMKARWEPFIYRK